MVVELSPVRFAGTPSPVLGGGLILEEFEGVCECREADDGADDNRDDDDFSGGRFFFGELGVILEEVVVVAEVVEVIIIRRGVWDAFEGEAFVGMFGRIAEVGDVFVDGVGTGRV